MIDKLLRNPLVLAGACLLSAMLGAGIFAWIQGARHTEIAGSQIRDYLLEHPEVLPEAMERLQARENAKAEKAQVAAQQSVGTHLPALSTPFASAWAGNPQGDVTVVAFMDYACGYCRASLSGLAELLQKDPGVRIVYREYPVLGDASVVASRWALAAAAQGKFRPFHDALFAAGGPSPETIAEAASKAGLDKVLAERTIRSPAIENEIRANHRLGEQLAMTGTPSWVIGGKLYYGARDYAGLSEAVAAARSGR
ncbi:DsbA family protein [Sphingomonas sp. MMS12-HWE2-04]|uniref:DsbA family protein n=1 Tax=Sphingomonas sp. MMS12-HWE2-04 TaxID=3234199 RepID=UPI00384A7D65